MARDEQALPWSEDNSRLFIEVGQVMIPRRDEIERAIVSLVPATPEEAFTFAELSPGSGWLVRALLERFPLARAIALDASPTMLDETGRALADVSGRVELREYRLEDGAWIDALPALRAVVSSLAVHHLDDDGKRRLFARLHARLEPGGALLIADLVQPSSAPALRYAAAGWDREVERQSIEQRGSDDVWQFFDREGWNVLRHPDPMDRPSNLYAQLRWLDEFGYRGVDCFWALAGHAVYGGYRG